MFSRPILYLKFAELFNLLMPQLTTVRATFEKCFEAIFIFCQFFVVLEQKIL